MTVARTWGALVAGYTAAVLLMLAPFSNYAAFGTAITPGDPKLMAWTFAWVNHAILAGLPLFDANIYYPTHQSLAYGENYLGVAIWGLPLWAATHNAVLVYSTLRVLALLLNALAMHLLAWRWTGSHKAALLAGLTFAVSVPRTFYSAGNVPIVWNCWLPLLVLAARQWTETRRPRWAALTTGLFCLQAIVGWYLAVIAAIALAAFGVWQALATLVPHRAVPAGGAAGNGARPPVRPGWRGWLWAAGQVAAGVAVTIAVMWPLARPYLVLVGDKPTIGAAVCANLRGYLSPSHYSLVAPVFVWVTGQSPQSGYGEHGQFLGWFTLALAGLGALRVATLVARGTRTDGERRDVVFGGYFVLLGLLGFALSLGPSGPRDWWRPFDLVGGVPGLNLFRAPARFAVLVVFAVAGLVAPGFRWAAGRFARTRPGWLCGGLAALMLVEWSMLVPPRDRPLPDRVPAVYALLDRLPVHAVVSLPCYRGGPDAPLDTDYMLYSTRQWRPIVNGYGRGAPDDTPWVVGTLAAFPGANSAKRMRMAGIDYVVVHPGRYADAATAADLVQQAMTGEDFELVARVEGDYLFHVRSFPHPPSPR
jgi:hypothetical protein